MDDAKIIELYWSRDERAATYTSKKYHDPCFYLANNILRDVHESEECVNDTWLKAWQSMPPKKPNSLKAFLLKITRNTAVSYIRRHTAKKRGGADTVISELNDCIPSAYDTERQIELNELTAGLNAFLSKLNEKELKAFVKRYFYCESVQDIAKQLNIPQNTVKSMLFRLRLKLKDHLEKEDLVP